MTKGIVTCPSDAVRVAFCAELAAVAAATNLALVAPAATMTEDGTVKSALLLERLTGRPLLPAATFSVTVQLSVPVPVIEVSVQLTPVSAAWLFDAPLPKETPLESPGPPFASIGGPKQADRPKERTQLRRVAIAEYWRRLIQYRRPKGDGPLVSASEQSSQLEIGLTNLPDRRRSVIKSGIYPVALVNFITKAIGKPRSAKISLGR